MKIFNNLWKFLFYKWYIVSIIYFINDILCQSYQIIKSLLIIKKVMYKRDYKDKHDIIFIIQALYRHFTFII